jgi:hypothetical protein
MYTLELCPSELLMLKEVLETDMDTSGWSEVDYSDPELMKYYSDRANVLVRINEMRHNFTIVEVKKETA